MDDKILESEKSIKKSGKRVPKLGKRRISINFIVDSAFYEEYKKFLDLKNIPGSTFVYLLIKKEFELFKEGKKGIV